MQFDRVEKWGYLRIGTLLLFTDYSRAHALFVF
jgi:hypothetical protein